MTINGIKEVVAIGDIHGTYTTMLALIEQIKTQFPNAQIAFCGDLCDRGPDSRSVVQYAIDNNIPTVKGNHEQMMIEHYNNTSEYPGNWLFNGGKETITSYNNHASDLVSHLLWMDTLPLYIEFKDCVREDGRYLVVSHSAPGKVWNWSEKRRKENFKQFQQVILWERDLYKDIPEIYQVFGHTPQAYNPKIKSFYANIDTGCVYRRPYSENYQTLTGLHYPSMTIIQQTNIEEKYEKPNN